MSAGSAFRDLVAADALQSAQARIAALEAELATERARVLALTAQRASLAVYVQRVDMPDPETILHDYTDDHGAAFYYDAAMFLKSAQARIARVEALIAAELARDPDALSAPAWCWRVRAALNGDTFAEAQTTAEKSVTIRESEWDAILDAGMDLNAQVVISFREAMRRVLFADEPTWRS